MSIRKKRWTIRRVFRTLEGASASILAFLSLFVLTGLLSDPNGQSFKLVPTKKHTILLEENSTGRGPASVQPTDTAAMIAADSVDVITVDCENSTVINTVALSIRLRGNSCNGSEITSSEVVNLTNEYTATVFQKAQWFTTDVIQLRPGPNMINISHHLADGSIEKYSREIEKK